jgi:hypothetical protein
MPTRGKRCASSAAAAALNSTFLSPTMKIERQMRTGEIDLVYVAPERLTDAFLDLLDRCKVAPSPSTRAIASRVGLRLPAGILAHHPA